MSLQVELLGSVVHRERTGALTRSGTERRRAARLLEAVRCCLRPSPAARLLDALDGPATGCCITR